MRKVLTGIYMLAMGAMVLSMSGCGGGSSNSFVENEEAVEVAEVAVIESPVFEQGHSYRMIEGAALSGMGGAKYFVADVGSEGNASVLNLGFAEMLGDNTLVFADDESGQVVFAYDPSGNDGQNKTSGTVRYSGGTRMKYTSLAIKGTGAAMFSAMNVDTAGAKVIVLSGDSATIDGEAVSTFNYVWHADPNHSDVYYTLGLDGTDELSEDYVAEVIGDQTVYIARDVYYMTDSLDFTGTVKNDEETEYAVYYSATVSADVAASKYPNSPDLWGPYIFATLPGSMGMGGMGGTPPDGGNGGTPPDGTNGGTPPDGGMGGTPPDGGNGGTPPNFQASASYNSQIASTMELMTHSAEDAYKNPVLHICKAGVYQLQGTWNGQIWIDVGEDSTDKVAIILNSVDVTCSVAPAIVFHDLYECGPDDEDEVASLMASSSSDIGYSVLDNAGAMVIIADDTVNNFTGANVYRMLKPQQKKATVTTIDGSDVDQQKKRWKMDGAFYSFVSLAMGGGSKQNGVLNVKSTTYEGLDTEMHMTLESGVLTVYAPDDGMNFNEDNTSVFTMISGDLTVTSTGGDGVDSNGWIAILGGSLDVTAAQDSNQLNAGAEGPLDADCGVYMASGVTYSHRAYSGANGGTGTPPEQNQSGTDTDNTQNQNQTGTDTDNTQNQNQTGTNTENTQNQTQTQTGTDTGNNQSQTQTGTDTGNTQTQTQTGTNNGGGTQTPVTQNNTNSEPSTPTTPTETPATEPEIPATEPETPATEPEAPTTEPETPTTEPEPVTEPETPVTEQETPTTEPETPTTEPEPEEPVIAPAPQNQDYTSDSISGNSGITTFSLGLSGSSMTIRTDPDAATPRGISSSSNVFQITRSVNTFSGITADN